VTTEDELLYMLWSYLGFAAVGAVVLVLLWPRGRRLLPVPRLRPGYWTGGFVVLVFLIYILTQLSAAWVVLGLMDAWHEGNDASSNEAKLQRAVILSSPLFLALALPMILGFLYRRTRTRPSQLGLTAARWRPNVVLGLLTFILTAPAVLGLYYLITQFLAPVQYPFEELVKHDFAAWEWGILGFQIIVVAPVLEEILFRGCVQGWLRRATLPGHVILMILAMMKSFDSPEIPARIFAAVLCSFYAGLLYWLYRAYLPAGAPVTAWNYQGGFPGRVDLVEEDEIPPPRDGAAVEDIAIHGDWQGWQRANAVIAIYGSAMLFAVFHPWPTPIPLFALALVLGWLAYRTQSLLSGITLHALFNAVSFVALYLTVAAAAEPNGKDDTVVQRPASTSSSVPGVWLPRCR
jgi:membrane protease YdiL (CAAX protease family)